MGLRWVYSEVSRDDLEPSSLMWDIHRRIHTQALPDRLILKRADSAHRLRHHVFVITTSRYSPGTTSESGPLISARI
jgi:hypothetical protein